MTIAKKIMIRIMSIIACAYSLKNQSLKCFVINNTILNLIQRMEKITILKNMHFLEKVVNRSML